MELTCQLVHLCNKNHGVLNLSLSMTLVVVVVMCILSYIMKLELILVKCFGKIHHLLPQSVISYPKFYVKEKVMNFLPKKCVGGNKCDDWGNLTLFHSKYPFDMNDKSLSNIIVSWKRYEYINPHTSSNVSSGSSRIDLLEDRICVI